MWSVVTEWSAGDEDALSEKRYDKDSINNDTFLSTVVVVMVVFTGLASLALLAFAVHRSQRGGTLQPLCSRTTKVEAGGTAAGQTLESIGMLPRSSHGKQNRRGKPPPPPPLPLDRILPTRPAETTNSRHHPSTVQGPSNLGAPPCPLPGWALPPPPPAPPPSSVVDDAFSEFASTFAVFPSTDNDDDDDDDDDDQLRAANTC